MAPVELRPAVPTDVPSLVHVLRRSSLSNDRDRPHLLAHPDLLVVSEEAVRDGRTVVASTDGQLIGFATFQEAADAFELVDLFVDPDHMRQGVGRRLIDSVVGEARSRGVARIEVTGNTHALAFYERAGFVVDGSIETRFDPALRMHLDVDRPSL